MADIDSNFSGSIPEVYDSHLVPILFEPYADNLADRIARTNPTDVLELAGGTGVVSRTLSPRLAAETGYVVTDLNPAMLEHARKRSADERIEWREANALSLPFPEDSFDIVLCQFGVMFFPDRAKGFSEARRVLRSGGRIFFNCWGALEENDFSSIAVDTLIEIYPNDPPLFLARTPFGYSEASQIEADLSEAGFGEVQITKVELQSRANSADDFAFGQTHGSPLRLEIEQRAHPSLQKVQEAVAQALVDRFGTGPITGRMMALVVEAVAP